MKIIERISQIIAYKSISIRAFEIKIGASNGMIGRAISKKTDISAEWLSKIIYNFSDISAEWLLTGDGDMLCSADGAPGIVQTEPVIIYRDNPKDAEIIALQREQIKLLKEQISDLKKVSTIGSVVLEDYPPAVEIISNGPHNKS